jgi:hypothetical protein
VRLRQLGLCLNTSARAVVRGRLGARPLVRLAPARHSAELAPPRTTSPPPLKNYPTFAGAPHAVAVTAAARGRRSNTNRRLVMMLARAPSGWAELIRRLGLSGTITEGTCSTAMRWSYSQAPPNASGSAGAATTSSSPNHPDRSSAVDSVAAAQAADRDAHGPRALPRQRSKPYRTGLADPASAEATRAFSGEICKRSTAQPPIQHRQGTPPLASHAAIP